jgi:hypothetical protein
MRTVIPGPLMTSQIAHTIYYPEVAPVDAPRITWNAVGTSFAEVLPQLLKFIFGEDCFCLRQTVIGPAPKSAHTDSGRLYPDSNSGH